MHLYRYVSRLASSKYTILHIRWDPNDLESYDKLECLRLMPRKLLDSCRNCHSILHALQSKSSLGYSCKNAQCDLQSWKYVTLEYLITVHTSNRVIPLTCWAFKLILKFLNWLFSISWTTSNCPSLRDIWNEVFHLIVIVRLLDTLLEWLKDSMFWESQSRNRSVGIVIKIG